MPSRPRHTGNRVRSVHVKTLGCKVNQAESAGVVAALTASGARFAVAREAEIVIVNTCSVTAEADRKARKAIRRALGSPAHPTVLVTGCLAALDPDGVAALGERVVVEPDRERVFAVASAVAGLVEVTTPPDARSANGPRTRVAVKVQDGCDACCAYCVVPFARGEPRSVDLRAVVHEVEALAASGVAEVVVTGINLGRYRSAGAALPGLVRAVASTGVKRVRLSSVEPLGVTRDLADTFAETPQLCPHLHVPLQSGSDDVLEAMRRGYSAAEYLERLALLRDAVPGIAVTTDVMVGFPGETESDFARTLSVIEQAEFARLHVFRYSSRAGTRAADLDGQVDATVASRRAAVVREYDARLRRAYARKRRGQEADVLVERVGADTTWASGTTEDYLKTRFAAATGMKQGDVVRVLLGDVQGDDVHATALHQ
ncbi:MAG TPA: tRNA (N(6)-L-threonylcarbamoyladenosine(37)-C(2))-methylthiotransferase MtaB [Coriobacteriia bacterium]|nr:tRNA (N(6)-L-threonylcarbamoyladenosine(37)-C(2))-methylthiotransferase MtaB [Coriobacteriia bacterium]